MLLFTSSLKGICLQAVNNSSLADMFFYTEYVISSKNDMLSRLE